MAVFVHLLYSPFSVASLSYSHVKGDRQHWQASSSIMDSTRLALAAAIWKENVIQCSVNGRVQRPFKKVLSFLCRIPTDARVALCFRAPRGPAFEPCSSSPLSVCVPHLNRCEALEHKSHAVFHLLHTAHNLKGPNEASDRDPKKFWNWNIVPLKCCIQTAG